MKDSEIKKLFAGLKIEAPAANFEDKIIAKSMQTKVVKQRPYSFVRYAAIAATVLMVSSFVIMNSNTNSSVQGYAKLVDESPIITEDDIYSGLIPEDNLKG